MAATFAVTPRLILQTKTHAVNAVRRRHVAASIIKDHGDGDGEEDSRLLRHFKALLGADDAACAQILSSPEGKAMAGMNLHTAALRIVRLRDALPVAELDVMAMVVEQPSLLVFEGDYDEVGE